MTAIEEIIQKIEAAEKAEGKLIDAYLIFLEHTPNLKTEDFDQSLERLQKINSNTLQSKSWLALSIGLRSSFRPEFGNPIETLFEACELFTQNNDLLGEGIAQVFLTLHYKNAGNLDKAQETVHRSIINIIESGVITYFLGVAYYQAGDIQQILKNYESAEAMFTKGLTYFKPNHPIYARLLNGIGCIYKEKNEPEKAFPYFQQSLKALEGKSHYVMESKNLADIGNYYFRKNDFENAILYQEKSMAIRRHNRMNNPLVTNYIELAEIYLKQNLFDKALEQAKAAETISIENKVVIKQYLIDLVLSTIYEAMDNPKMALEYYKKYHEGNVELLANENTKRFKEATAVHEFETLQKEKEISLLKNVVLKEALDEITASVRYAKRIQEAILPPVESIKSAFGESFVLYKPKDVVAGDFFFMETIGENTFLAAADCTGHGVPGALVSVICSNALNRAVYEYKLTDPGQILDQTTHLVCETFAKSLEEVKDGMDISLLVVNKSKKEISWSGANNPLWYFENKEMHEILADKQPIGKSDTRKPFSTHSLTYQEGTTYFLFTDGFADQFGGPAGKKFKYKPFKELLAKNVAKKASEQQLELNIAFENWKGELEQVDDVCVIGVRV